MKHMLIICNGNPPSKQLFTECCANAEYVIAADGGGNTALNFGFTPDVVIGDFDSFIKTGDEAFEVIFDADQETNDLEKALQLAKKKQATHVQILGATGNRLDHTLKNLSVLKQFDPYFMELTFRDDFGETWLIKKEFCSEIPVDTEISLFPLSGEVTGISTTGLQYPLNNEALENGVRDGSSNRVMESPVKITYQDGDLLLFVVT